MPIHDQGYRRYGGQRGQRRGWWVIASTTIRAQIRRRRVIALLLAAWLPFLVRAVLLYAAANFQHSTGTPWGRRERVNGLGVPVTIRVEQIDGSRRVSDWNFLDVRVQKDFRIGGARVAGFLDILNATNSDAYQSIGSDLGSSSAFGTPTFFVNPRTVMLGAKVRF